MYSWCFACRFAAMLMHILKTGAIENAELCGQLKPDMEYWYRSSKTSCQILSSEDTLASLTSLERNQRDERCKYIWARIIIIFLSWVQLLTSSGEKPSKTGGLWVSMKFLGLVGKIRVHFDCNDFSHKAANSQKHEAHGFDLPKDL